MTRRRPLSLATLARSFTSKMASAPTDALRAWGAQKGLDYLGEGESRAVFALPDGETVVKFVFSYYGEEANLDEARAWREASPRVRRFLVPVLDADPEGRWLVMERVTPADVNARTHAAVDALLACGFADINNRNLSADGRLLDYGKHIWTMWGGDCVALPNPRTGFLDDFDAATVPCPFSTKRGYMQMFPDVPVSIGLTHEDGDTYVTLEMFEAHPGVRATGAGTEAMRRLLDLTDKHGLSVYLDPHPLDEGWSWDRLVRWYASFGFDFEEDAEYREESGNYWMQRLPHAKGARRPNPRRRNSAYEPLRWEEGDEDDLDFEAVGHLTDATSAVLHGLELSGQGAASSEAVARAWTGQGVPSTARMLYLHDVTVAPHLRGRGAGRRYVAGIERDARASGAQGVVLHALHSLGFWQKQGYALWPFPPAERPEQSAVMFKVFGHRQNPRGDTALRTDPELWEEVKASVLAGSKGGRPGQWSARKAQLAVAIYKQEGGGYVGPKSPANSLARWTRQKWRTKSGRPSLETGERYLPAAAIAALTPAEYAATTRAKRAGMKQGQQFVPQPEKVALKVRPYRRRNPRRPISKARFLELLADPTTRRATRRFLRALEDYQSIEVAKEGFRDAYAGLPEEVREAIAPPARGMKQLWRGDDGQSKRDVLSWTRHPQYATLFGRFLFNSGRDLVGYDAAVDPSRVRALIANTPLEDEFYIKDDEGEVILIGPRWKRTLTSAELRARHLA